VGIEDDGGDRDRARERTAADLVDAGDPTRAQPEAFALEVEMGTRFFFFQASGPLRKCATSKA
jgi:hypothetical protein